jgi:hypothetical protein
VEYAAASSQLVELGRLPRRDRTRGLTSAAGKSREGSFRAVRIACLRRRQHGKWRIRLVDEPITRKIDLRGAIDPCHGMFKQDRPEALVGGFGDGWAAPLLPHEAKSRRFPVRTDRPANVDTARRRGQRAMFRSVGCELMDHQCE